MRLYVLDACALAAVLYGETGADNVAHVINAAERGEVLLTMNKLNLLEVYYDAYRSLGREWAAQMLMGLRKMPITVNSDITDEIFLEAGRLKATYKISLADSIALAQASTSDGILLTSDHHEFDVVEKNEKIKFGWIR